MLLPSKRALLLGGAAAGAFAGSAYADQPFTGFQFKSQRGVSPGRTMPQRLDDVFNVKDFGAKGSPGVNDRAAIQSCIDAACAVLPGSSTRGVTVFFPPGAYNIDAPLTVNGTLSAGIKFLGSGGAVEADLDTSKIWGNVNGYLLKFVPDSTGHYNPSAMHSIRDLSFDNHFAGAPGSTVDTQSCAGGVNIPGGIGASITGCNFSIGTGVCLFSNCQNMQISSCNAYSVSSFNGYIGFNASDSLGFIGQNLSVRDCKIHTIGYGFVAAGGINAAMPTLSNIDFEQCGCPIYLGGCPIGVLVNLSPPSPGTIQPAGPGYIYIANISNINIENPGSIDNSSPGVIVAKGGEIQRLYIQGVNCAADGAKGPSLAGVYVPPYGLRLEGAIRQGIFEGIQMSGTDSYGAGTGGFGVSPYSINAQCDGVRFFGCIGSNTHTGAGPIWDLSGMTFPAGADGVSFDRCKQTDGAVAFANLPPSPSSFGQTMVCNNSNLPATAANFGAAIAGGGSNKVVVRWCGSPLAWRIAG